MPTRKLDGAWMHGTEVVVEGNGGKVGCNYCSKVVNKITRFKQHLAIEGTDVTGCPNVPSEVSEEMRYRLHNNARPVVAVDHGLNSQGQEAVNQLPGYYVQSPQQPNQLGLMMTRSARAVTLPSYVLIIQPNGTIPLSSQNPPCDWMAQTENIFMFPHLGPVYCWVNGFWHGPYYGTSNGTLPLLAS